MIHPTLRHLLIAFMVALLTVVGVGCATTGKLFNADTKGIFTFDVWPEVNPDDSGRASPVVVSVFELEDARQFSQEDFIHLYQEPQKYLGKDIVRIHRLKEFTPGYNRELELVLDPNTRFIGLLAEFVQYDNAQGRLVIEVKPHQKNTINIRLSKLVMEQTLEKPGANTKSQASTQEETSTKQEPRPRQGPRR